MAVDWESASHPRPRLLKERQPWRDQSATGMRRFGRTNFKRRAPLLSFGIETSLKHHNFGRLRPGARVGSLIARRAIDEGPDAGQSPPVLTDKAPARLS
jgi:hypothetical protein